MKLVRAGLIALASISILGLMWELAAERHWATPIQLVPWAVLAVLALATALVALPARPWRTTLARTLAVVALLASMFGVFQHTVENYREGAQASSQHWEESSELRRVVLAATKTVGGAPPLAPGGLGQTALLLLLATVGRGNPATTARLGAVTPSRASG